MSDPGHSNVPNTLQIADRVFVTLSYPFTLEDEGIERVKIFGTLSFTIEPRPPFRVPRVSARRLAYETYCAIITMLEPLFEERCQRTACPSDWNPVMQFLPPMPLIPVHVHMKMIPPRELQISGTEFCRLAEAAINNIDVLRRTNWSLLVIGRC